MAGSSAIEWTDATWNPVTGCTRVSPGCAHCYIERTPPFRMESRRFTHGADGATTGVRLHPERLKQPLTWRKPRRVFVNSLSDLFHEEIPLDFIHDVFQTMERAEQHIFQVLTKRPERALKVMCWLYTCSWCDGVGCAACDAHDDAPRGMKSPLPNVWMGVSIENSRFTWRADVLREIPAAVRFVSAEPLLGSLFEHPRASLSVPVVDGELQLTGEDLQRAMRDTRDQRAPLNLRGIDWVIVGGESGPGARSMSLGWARELVRACRDNGVACFVKQLGSKPVGGMDLGTRFYLPLRSKKGGDPGEWPEDLVVREFPKVVAHATR